MQITSSTLIRALYVLVVATIIATVLVVLSQPSKSFANNQPGLPATVASSSVETVGTASLTLIATSSCSARIITTYAQPIMLTFRDTDTPTGLFGHLQAASTTIAYSSSQFGCGKIKGIVAGTSAGTVTATDSQ